MSFFSIIPSEIIIDILSRLNVGDILKCKRVCNSWLHLVGTDHFVNSHLSRSVHGFFDRVVWPNWTNCCEILEFGVGNENQFEMGKLYLNSVMRFNIPLFEDTKLDIHSSANGLIFLVKTESMGYEFYETNYICNPITRQYINICSRFARHSAELVSYEFGVSKLGKHTVLRVRQSQRNIGEKYINCDVYTLGSVSWTSVAPPDPSWCCETNTPLEFVKYSELGPCLDGRFHWLNLCWKSPHILCFDLETELFSIYDPPLPLEVVQNREAALSSLADSLCLCQSTSDGMIVWLAEKCGVEKSWIKGFVISKTPNLPPSIYNLDFKARVSVVKAFKNNDHLHVNDMRRIRYSPSFLSLTSFNMENVISF